MTNRKAQRRRRKRRKQKFIRIITAAIIILIVAVAVILIVKSVRSSDEEEEQTIIESESTTEIPETETDEEETSLISIEDVDAAEFDSYEMYLELYEAIFTNGYSFDAAGWYLAADTSAAYVGMHFFSPTFQNDGWAYTDSVWEYYEIWKGDEYKPVPGDIVLYYRYTDEDASSAATGHIAITAIGYDESTNEYVTLDGSDIPYGDYNVSFTVHPYNTENDRDLLEAVIWHCTDDDLRESIVEAVYTVAGKYKYDPDGYVEAMTDLGVDSWCWVNILNVFLNVE